MNTLAVATTQQNSTGAGAQLSDEMGETTATSSGSQGKDRWCIPASVAVALVFGALAMFYSLVLYSHFYSYRLHGQHVWYAPSDVWMTVDTGRSVWTGSLNFLYHNYYGFFALPLSSMLLAPAAALIDHFNLAEGLFPIAQPSAWLLVGPYTLLFGIFLLDAVRRLAWELGVRRRLLLLQVLSTFLVLTPCFEWGHFEDGMALTFTIHAVRYMLRRDPIRAALLLSLAVSTKQWAVMLVPFLAFSAPAGRRLRTAITACALPALMVGFFLLIDYPDASRAFFNPPSPAPHTGHAAIFVTWFGMQTARVGRLTGVLLAAGLGWRVRRMVTPARIFMAASLILLLRPLSEPVNWSYYWSPALLLAGFAGVAAHRRMAWRDWIGPSLAMLWTVPHGGTPSTPWWWLATVALLVLTVRRGLLNCGLDLRPARLRSHLDRRSARTRDASPTRSATVDAEAASL